MMMNLIQLIIKNSFLDMKLLINLFFLYAIKKRISEKSGFPIETMIQIGTYGGQKYIKDVNLWIIIYNYNYEQNITIGQNVYNSPIIRNRYVYNFIDINQKKIFLKLNEK